VVRETVKVEHWTPVTWSGASLTQWTNISQNVIDEAVDQNSSFDKRKLILIILSSRCAFVVRWAVPQTAKDQQRTCHYCASPAKKMGDLLSIRKLAVRETARQLQFNNARAIIVPAEHNSWATCGSLRQRLSSCAPDVNFLANFAAVVWWAVREKAKVQQRRCHYLPVVR